MSDDLETLREENATYHQQMQQLNEEMDRMLLKRDKKSTKPTSEKEARGDGKSYELRQAIAKNENLRKERLKWNAEISHSDTAVRISETKNQLGIVEQRILAIKEDIRGLENIRNNQQGVVDVAKHADDEVKYLQSQHRDEVLEFRENWRALNEENKFQEKILSGWQNKYHGAMEKVKLNLDSTDVEELRSTVDSQGAEIEDLSAKLEELTSQHQTARRQTNKGTDSHTRERQQLNKELEQVKMTLGERERELKLSYARGNRMGGSQNPGSPTSA